MMSLAESPSAILIIDDNAVIIRVLRGLLRDMARLFFAKSGEDGIRIAGEQTPDLILLDVELPGMSGYDVCRQIRTDARMANCAIIIMTAHSDRASEVAALESGAVDFVAKPFNPPVLKTRVRSQLRLQRQAALLANLSSCDNLTGLYNRRHFEMVFAQELSRHQRQQMPLGLVLIDIDHFKGFNDCYGRLIGDHCLQQVAACLEITFRRAGESAARYGGAEFAVILPHADSDHTAQNLGERLCSNVRALQIPHEESAAANIVTTSVGLVIRVPTLSDTPQQLMMLADRALCNAKLLGRNRAVVSTER